MNNEDKYIDIIDDNGESKKAEVLFTFENEDDKYVLFTFVDELDEIDNIDGEYEVLAYMYEETDDNKIGNLIEIDEDDEERWNIVSEVFATFEETAFSYAEE